MMKLLAILTLFISQFASAMVLTEFAAVNYFFPRYESGADPTIDSSAGFSGGGGLAFGFRLTDHFEIEVGTIYISRAFSVTRADQPRTGYRLFGLQVPILLRYWVSENFAVGAGPMVTSALRSVTVSRNDRDDYIGYPDLNWRTTVPGLVLSIRYWTPINHMLRFVIDQRLLVGAVNADTSGSYQFRYQDLQTWVGVAFSI